MTTTQRGQGTVSDWKFFLLAILLRMKTRRLSSACLSACSR
jgi:hypothetical protein